MSILTYKHGKLDGPFEIRNSTQGQDFLVIGTFGNFEGPPPDIYRLRLDDTQLLSQYVVGKLFVSLYNSSVITVDHFNEKHQRNGIAEMVSFSERRDRQITPDIGEIYSSGGIIIMRHYNIDGRDVTAKEYAAYVTELKEGIATVDKGKDVTSLISSYLL